MLNVVENRQRRHRQTKNHKHHYTAATTQEHLIKSFYARKNAG